MKRGESHPPIVKKLVWTSENQTRLFASKLAEQPALRDAFIELHGELGAGKTTLVRHLLHALGVSGRIKSPTYTVVESYTLSQPILNIWHFDFYRFQDQREWEDAGFRDIFASTGLKLAEWPQNAGPALPQPDLTIAIEALDDDSRQISLSAHTLTGETLMQGSCP